MTLLGETSFLYISDISYLDGIIFDNCMANNIEVYTSRYPYGIISCNGSSINSRNVALLEWPNHRCSDKDIENYMFERLQDPSKKISYFKAENEANNLEFILGDLNEKSNVLMQS